MTTETPARQLAQALVERLLAADPFTGTGLGLREYDALVPDPSAAAEDRLAGDLATIATQARSVSAEDDADAVTLDVVTATCDRRRRLIESRWSEYTVTAMPIAGPPSLLAVLAQTSLADAQSAARLPRARPRVGVLDRRVDAAAA